MKALACVVAAVVITSMGAVLGQGKFVGISENPDRTIDAGREEAVEDLLEKTILLDLEIDEVDYLDALSIIQSSAERLYFGKLPFERQGLSFSVEGPRPGPKVTLRGKRVSLGLALDELCRQAGMLWTNKAYTISLKPGQRLTQRRSPFPGALESAAMRQ
ncbi:MAG: hypothetical protein JNJ70_03340 [Verrucomicrobiales bacterium]|nr:hypothetical protein [Verrucomicrobiales bacterium]